LSRSKKVIFLATFAVLSFPLTIALVALDLRSLISQKNVVPEGDSTKETGSGAELPSGNAGDNQTAVTPNSPPKVEDEVISVLQSRVLNLRNTMEQAKVEEVRIRTELQSNQDLQVNTRRSLKATERAIEEIKNQAPEQESAKNSTLRSSNLSEPRARSMSSKSAPNGWENYYGILGVGYGRPYRMDELQQPQAFMRSIEKLTDSIKPQDSDSGSELNLRRVVHISGLEGTDPSLEELRRIGREKATEIKRVRHVLPGFESNYMMVQVFPDLSSRQATGSSMPPPQSETSR
jgi:hypothetical protein